MAQWLLTTPSARMIRFFWKIFCYWSRQIPSVGVFGTAHTPHRVLLLRIIGRRSPLRLSPAPDCETLYKPIGRKALAASGARN